MRLFALVLSVLLAETLSASPLRVDGKVFRDQRGNQVILRGVNVSGASKLPPFRVIDGELDFKPLPAWGFNSLRLLFNWEAFQSQRDRYDETYLQYYLDLIRAAKAYNLYVIVDIHQDAFSRFSGGGCGDGFPEWSLAPAIPRDIPKNDQECKSWGTTTVMDLKMHWAWREFFKNSNGVRDEYLNMLRVLSRALAPEANVIGIDLLNEPWADEKSELYPLYHDAAKVVRQELPDTILFLSGAAITSTGLVPSKLARIPFENLAHATHFYDPGISFDKWSPWTLEFSSLTWKKIEEEWQAPVFVGEFGASPTLTGAAAYVESIYNLLDRGLYSGSYWVYTPTWNEETKDGWNREDFSISDDRGRLRGVYRPRPWIEKVSGSLIAMGWNANEAKLSVVFRGEGSSNFIEIMVPQAFQWAGPRAGESPMTCEPMEWRRLRCRLSGPESPSSSLSPSLIFRDFHFVAESEAGRSGEPESFRP